MAGPLDIGVLDQTVTKYLSRAGTDPRCTPKVLREKTEDKMKLDRGTLDAFKPRIKKLIIKWWKETGRDQVGNNGTSSSKIKAESRDTVAPAIVPPSEEEVRTWKAFKAFSKASGKGAELLMGLNEIKVAGDRIAALRKRVIDANLSFSDPHPTESEIAAMKDSQNKKRPLEGGEAEEPQLKKEA